MKTQKNKMLGGGGEIGYYLHPTITKTKAKVCKMK